MARIFISYRRSDTGAYADRVAAHLRAFQFDAVFQDREEIDLAENYADEIRQALGLCDAVLVLIGPGWLSAVDQAGRKRLQDTTDWVRREVALALSTKTRVVPVLFDGARMPAASDMPADLAPLATLKGYDINGNYFDRDADDLAKRLERLQLLTARDDSDPRASLYRGLLRQIRAISIGLCAFTLGSSVVPSFAPAVPESFWVFPASLAVPTFLYWLYLHGESLRPVRSRAY